MKIVGLVAVLALGGMIPPGRAQTAGQASALDRVLERMGSTGKNFRSFQANFSQQKYISVLKEFEKPETGTFTYARAKDGSALLRQEFKTPGRKILTIKGGEATVYQPSLNQAMIVNLGKNRDKAEFLALGIGQSPAKMRETFDIEYRGEEKLDNLACSVLVMKPKSTAAAAYFSVITLWISNASNIPIQQKLQEPSGDYLLNRFTSEKVNVSISESLFEQKLPKGVDIQRMR